MSYTHVGPDKNGSVIVDAVVPYNGVRGPLANLTVDIPIIVGSTPSSHNRSNDDSDHILIYVLVPLGSLVLIAVLSFLVVFILKKSRLDKLRHHLMPLYNFDPAEEEGDWESELLEEEKEQQVALHIRSPSPDGPRLKFSTESMEV